jgi:uncharacterized protein
MIEMSRERCERMALPSRANQCKREEMTTSNEATLKEGLIKLAGLAEVESRIFKIQRQLEDIPQNLRELEEKLAQSESLFQEKKQKFEELERTCRQKETEMSDSREKSKIREARLYEIKTTKEYQAAVKEIAAAKKQSADWETQGTQMKEQMEALQKELAPLEEDLNRLKENVQTERDKISGDLEGLKKQLEEEQTLKGRLFAELDKALVARYERILRQRQPAMAPVRSGTCQECNMHLPPQLYIEIQKYREVISCPSCNRILYLPVE